MSDTSDLHAQIVAALDDSSYETQPSSVFKQALERWRQEEDGFVLQERARREETWSKLAHQVVGHENLS